eukprot:NODE_1479_length_1403_cov_26.813146_g1228_i0.p1 GENE.NODE_1479_length_1403_cov_26.813146_g1228_i0~~NODE_1479_length_1403_cov_26.813146_g1228_i0.p1  ORF type:complete len:420 (+),score=144.61 NODE_1479_length_1403_cov_26.813146_g1228_i0:119-1261(+)
MEISDLGMTVQIIDPEYQGLPGYLALDEISRDPRLSQRILISQKEKLERQKKKPDKILVRVIKSCLKRKGKIIPPPANPEEPQLVTEGDEVWIDISLIDVKKSDRKAYVKEAKAKAAAAPSAEGGDEGEAPPKKEKKNKEKKPDAEEETPAGVKFVFKADEEDEDGQPLFDHRFEDPTDQIGDIVKLLLQDVEERDAGELTSSDFMSDAELMENVEIQLKHLKITGNVASMRMSAILLRGIWDHLYGLDRSPEARREMLRKHVKLFSGWVRSDVTEDPAQQVQLLILLEQLNNPEKPTPAPTGLLPLLFSEGIISKDAFLTWSEMPLGADFSGPDSTAQPMRALPAVKAFIRWLDSEDATDNEDEGDTGTDGGTTADDAD